MKNKCNYITANDRELSRESRKIGDNTDNDNKR